MKQNKFNKNKMIALILIMALIFVLFVATIIVHFNKYDGLSLSLLIKDLRWVFFACVILLPILLFLLITFSE